MAIDGSRTRTSPLALQFAASPEILKRTRALAGDSDRPTDVIADSAADDPVIVIELLKAANAVAYSEGKPPVTTIKAALIRLGGNLTKEKFDDLTSVQPLDSEALQRVFEKARTRCRLMGKITRGLAEELARQLVDDSVTAGLLYNVGELIAIAHLGDEFLKLSADAGRAKILYRLEKNHSFSVQKMCVNYLKRAGIPETLLFALDPEGSTKVSNRAILKPLCSIAEELLNAFEADRWEKVGPEGNLPPKSPLRMMQLNARQHEALYERVGQLLFSDHPDKARP